jgi:hypothetical protein
MKHFKLNLLCFLTFSLFLNLNHAEGQCINCTDTNSINNNLIFCLPFNGNANDETGNGYDGSVSGATLSTDRFGNANKAYYFDGTNDYIDLAQNLPDMTTLSMSLWVKPTGNASTNGFIVFDGDANCGNDLYIYYKNGVLYFAANKGGAQLDGTSGSGVVSASILNSWTHVAWTMTSTQSLIYLNGSLVATFNKTASQTGYHNTPSIGSLNDGGGAPCGSARSDYFEGYIDDIRLYDRVLSSTEVTQLSECINSYFALGKNSPFTTALNNIERLNSNSTSIHVYPNPASNSFTIQSPSALDNNTIVELYDMTGKRVFLSVETNISIEANQLKISNLALHNGVYLIRLKNKEVEFHSSIVIVD